MPRSEENDKGVVFPGPLTKRKVRSTTEPGKAVVAAALPASDDSAKCLAERNWRFGYVKHYRRLVEAQCGSGGRATVDSSKAGLKAAADTFVFIGRNGDVPSRSRVDGWRCSGPILRSHLSVIL